MNRAKCEREHAVEVGHRREQLLHESGLSLAGVVGSARRCGGAVGRVRAVTAWGTGFKAERNNGVTAQACRVVTCSGARNSGSGGVESAAGMKTSCNPMIARGQLG